MKIRIEDIEYRPELHEGDQAESDQERMVWAVLDHVDNLFTALAATVIVAPLTDEQYATIPSGPPKLRALIAAAFAGYAEETAGVLSRLDALRFDEDHGS